MGRGPVGAPAIIRYGNNSLASVDDVSGINGSMTLIKTLTASSSSTLDFVDGTNDVVLDNTYPIYLFKCIGIHPATNDTGLQWNMTIDGGSNWNVSKMSTAFRSRHAEDNSYAVLEYRTGEDLDLSTNHQWITAGQGNGNDEDGAGELWLFNPSSTTFVKHFMSTSIMYYEINAPFNWFMAGYGNTTSAVDGIQFKFNSGNIDAGQIKLYGIKDS
jgi:hypothetical protein